MAKSEGYTKGEGHYSSREHKDKPMKGTSNPGNSDQRGKALSTDAYDGSRPGPLPKDME